MASPGDDSASNAHSDQAESVENTPEKAFQEAQNWIEAVTGRGFGEKDFRSGLENGILLCELLSSVKPGLVKKINRLPTPIAGLDNLTMFLRGCEELGLKGSQLFDPGDLQDTSIRANLTGSDCSRKLKNVLITIYWLGKAANSCATYNGPTLNLKEFEGLLSMMRKECVSEELDSPKRSIRDSGYIDSWESERSDSLSPPRHGRDDSFDSLDSFGSRSQNTPSPDTVICCNSDSEGDGSQRKLPDVRKDDMSARRVSYKEPRAALPFNQYLPNKSNQTNYLPAPLRKRRSEREEDRRSMSTSPVGGDRPLREESVDVSKEGAVVSQSPAFQKTVTWAGEKGVELDEAELKKMRKLEKAGIKVLPACARYCSEADSNNPFLTPEKASECEEENKVGADREAGGRVVVPNATKDDLARRRSQSGPAPQRDPRQSLAQTTITQSDLEKWQRLKMNTESSDEPIVPLCQSCLEKGCLSIASNAKVAKNDLAGCRERPSGERRRFVTFGGVTEMESTSWIDEDKGGGEEERGEAEKLRYLLSMAPVAVPTIGLGSILTKRAVRSGDAIPEPPVVIPPEPPSPVTFDLERPSSSAQLRALEEQLAVKAKDERDDDEEEEEEDRQPDITNDDMLARRTGAFQKTSKGMSYNRFLPQPASKREVTAVALSAQKGSTQMSMSGERDLQYLEGNIKTKRTRIGQRNEPSDQEPNTQKSPDIVRSPASRVDNNEDDECWDEDPLPNVEKDDMLARRTGAFQKSRGGFYNAFLPTSGAVKQKTSPITGMNQSCFKKTDSSLDSFALSSVAPPPRDAEDTPRKCPQMMDRQESGSVGLMGQDSLIKDETNTKSPSPMPEQASRRPLWLEDDDLPPIFRATSVSNESESMSLIDMRDEEDEMAYLQPHSQSRHECLHNQYNKLREEEDQWQDDLARWKNRRRSASQDLIKKEEERKMMEKLMSTDGGSGHRRKSIKTYKEIVEEKERREQELHEQYCKASTPEEKAAILQRYALRFTISDAILEKLQLPKLPSATTPVHSSPLHESVKQSTHSIEAEVAEPTQTSPTQHSLPTGQQTAQKQLPRKPKTPEQLPTKTIKTPEVPPAPARPLPSSSKPVPLITPKPYSQPKLNQGPRKPLKIDGFMRLNGESTQDDNRQSGVKSSLVHSVPFSSTLSKPATQSQPNDELHVLETPHHQQNSPVSVPDQEKETVKEEKESSLSIQEENSKADISSTQSESEPEGKQTIPEPAVKRNCIVTTTIVTELTQTHPLQPNDTSSTEQLTSLQSSSGDNSTTESSKADQTSYSQSLTEMIDYSSECIETPMLNLTKRVNHWTWDPNEERKRQERWQQEQERLLQEKYQREQEKLKEEWERAQREVEEEERRHHEEERRILEETLTPRASDLCSKSVTQDPSLSQPSHDTIVLSLADWERKQEMMEKQAQMNQSNELTDRTDQVSTPVQQNGQKTEPQESQTATPQLQFIQDSSWSCKSKSRQEDLKKTASLDRNQSPPQSQSSGMRRTGSCENVLGTHPSKSPSPSQDTSPPSPSRSISGKKLCSSCTHPLGKGAAMIIESLGLYFHIQCFKCGICKGLLGDTSAGTDVRIRNGLLNCHECYIKSRDAGQPTTL
ncbi:LIM and calponin homology domains-containing protein 1a isoform X5 [Triplophysa rosa]|uniref:LIM and calponin homology domains-containing protein 1a isoform X5 n=1 Tax=Triplophysa rosa TaxID=992332 RepID=UPI00254621A2|nr:LIM and calponin homology domains-containing protein 1a isoform X5 [Triplophysa rosa]